MLKKSFLLTMYEDWTQHHAYLEAEEKALRGERLVELRLRTAKSAGWRAHYAKLLKDGYGMHVPQ